MVEIRPTYCSKRMDRRNVCIGWPADMPEIASQSEHPIYPQDIMDSKLLAVSVGDKESEMEAA